jgi:predicted oxidoreductase (fatty acid repression mutant protein)
LGIIFEDENNSDGIHKVLKHLHDQIPRASDQSKTIMQELLVTNLQLKGQ